MRQDDWRHSAACRPGTGIDPELFFRTGQGDMPDAQLHEALAVCGRCPVARRCLDFANQSPAGAFGIWGGWTPAERRRARWKPTPPKQVGGFRNCDCPPTEDNKIDDSRGRVQCRRCRIARAVQVTKEGNTFCRHNHRLDEANTHIDGDGKRTCRRCRADRQSVARREQGVTA